MNGTINDFSFGMITPVTAYAVACVGAALGLRCVARTVHHAQGWRPGWLALGSASLGCGIWTMHFIAMVGFRVEETSINYDLGLTVLSLALAITVVGIGVFIVGYAGASRMSLSTAGTLAGLGVAAMHYVGMDAMHLNGEIRYDTRIVALSVVVAIVAATVALWATVSIRGFLSSLAASLVMGIAVTGMHYTGMAAVSVHLRSGVDPTPVGHAPTSLLLPMLIVPCIFLVLATVVVMFDPLLVLGEGEWKATSVGPTDTPLPAWSSTPQKHDRSQSTSAS
ncbi:MHYT domain-containing protein [Streptomyces sp. NPDC087659]|uniref:MHYT domain-containing protein n=1 Tax=Streptomyces sp. NPDC087659 TaxID=3365801 RepID=UPI003815E2BB